MGLDFYPYHKTILEEVRENGYQTNFYYGGWIGFNSMEKFLNYHKFDTILEQNKFDSIRFESATKNNSEFAWDYVDRDLIDQSFLWKKNLIWMYI